MRNCDQYREFILEHLYGLLEPSERVSKDYHAQIARAETELQATQKQLQETTENRQKKINQIWNDINTQRLNMTVTGPQKLQAGAPNHIRVATTDLNNRPAAVKLSVKVVNNKDEVLYKKSDLPSTGDQDIPLPADLPVSPTSELSLVVSAR